MSPNDDRSDEELMARLAAGEREVLAELFERHHRAVFHFLRRLGAPAGTAEDLVQESFCRMLRFHGTYRGRGSFTAWMYRLVRNVWLDHRQRRVREGDGDADPSLLVSGRPGRPRAISSRSGGGVWRRR